jgi:hypothetical protein
VSGSCRSGSYLRPGINYCPPTPTPTPTCVPRPTIVCTTFWQRLVGSCRGQFYQRPGISYCTPTPTPVTTTPTLAPTAPGTPIVVPACNPSDINKDGVTDTMDYSILVSDFFKTNPTHPGSDINHDGIVDTVDYSLLVANFFKSTGACQ